MTGHEARLLGHAGGPSMAALARIENQRANFEPLGCDELRPDGVKLSDGQLALLVFLTDRPARMAEILEAFPDWDRRDAFNAMTRLRRHGMAERVVETGLYRATEVQQ